MIDLEKQFEQDMLADSQEYTEITKTSPSRYLQMIKQYGGVATARSLVMSTIPGEGFVRACEYDCLHLTVEHLMFYGREGAYHSLFSKEELRAARNRLRRSN